jgi:hypothetical protein
MTLQELQKMIKEEFNHFINEQPGGPGGAPPMPPMGGPTPPPAPGLPGIDVAPGDVDAMEPPAGGPDGAEAQLQKIFGILKTYFEGGEEGMEPEMDDMDVADDDMGDDLSPDAPDTEPMADVEADDEEEEPTVITKVTKKLKILYKDLYSEFDETGYIKV